jgi:hypothetical protein
VCSEQHDFKTTMALQPEHLPMKWVAACLQTNEDTAIQKVRSENNTSLLGLPYDEWP